MGRIFIAIAIIALSFPAMASTPEQFQPYQLENSITVDDVGINHIGAGSEMEVEIFQPGIAFVGAGSGDDKALSKITDNRLSITATAFYLEDPGRAGLIPNI